MMDDDFNPNMPEPVKQHCPVCGADEECLAFDDLGYCPATDGWLDYDLRRQDNPYKPIEPAEANAKVSEIDDFVPF